jgi:hypothetical protein
VLPGVIRVNLVFEVSELTSPLGPTLTRYAFGKWMIGYKLHEFGDKETGSDVEIYTRKSKVAPVPREDSTFREMFLG